MTCGPQDPGRPPRISCCTGPLDNAAKRFIALHNWYGWVNDDAFAGSSPDFCLRYLKRVLFCRNEVVTDWDWEREEADMNRYTGTVNRQDPTSDKTPTSAGRGCGELQHWIDAGANDIQRTLVSCTPTHWRMDWTIPTGPGFGHSGYIEITLSVEHLMATYWPEMLALYNALPEFSDVPYNPEGNVIRGAWYDGDGNILVGDEVDNPTFRLFPWYFEGKPGQVGGAGQDYVMGGWLPQGGVYDPFHGVQVVYAMLQKGRSQFTNQICRFRNTTRAARPCWILQPAPLTRTEIQSIWYPDQPTRPAPPPEVSDPIEHFDETTCGEEPGSSNHVFDPDTTDPDGASRWAETVVPNVNQQSEISGDWNTPCSGCNPAP